MSDLTVEEKMRGAEYRGRERAAERHFYEANQPHFPCGFSVHRRNPGHWDVYATRAKGRPQAFYAANPGGMTTEKDPERERAFRIRGEPGRVLVADERWNPLRERGSGDGWLHFKSVMGAMVYIMQELMQEPE